MSHPTPTRLQMAKASLTATVVVSAAAALTVGVASPAPDLLDHEKRLVSTQVTLAAESDDTNAVVGIYGVGPIFWTADLLGLTPDDLLDTVLGLVGDSDLGGQIGDILDLLGENFPIGFDVKGPLPSDVYDGVNDLNYSGTGTVDLLRTVLSTVLGENIVNAVWDDRTIPIIGTIPGLGSLLQGLVGTTPLFNQRRAILLSDNLGGLSTALAYRQMIDAVVNNSADWGEGVTGQWLLNYNNPSRPGGGLAALLTPFTALSGLNLSMPDAGSYTNGEANGGNVTKILNTSILDVAYAYSLMSDAPTTFSAVAWANALVGALLPTYVIPDNLDLTNTNLDELTPGLTAALTNGLGTMIDPTGGQGTSVIPGLGPILGVFGLNIDGLAGTGNYLTYDSGNLPLLEPFELGPRLLNLIPGFHFSTALTDSVQDALQMMVNMGYQDVDPETLQRSYDEGGEQAYVYHSALTPTQQFDATNLIVNTLISGIQDNALTPSKWATEIAGMDLTPLLDNDLTRPVAAALRQALEVVRTVYNSVSTAVSPAFHAVTNVLDNLNDQITAALDSSFKPTAPADDSADSADSAASITSIPSRTKRVRTLEVSAKEVEGTAKVSADKVTKDKLTKDEETIDVKDDTVTKVANEDTQDKDTAEAATATADETDAKAERQSEVKTPAKKPWKKFQARSHRDTSAKRQAATSDSESTGTGNARARHAHGNSGSTAGHARHEAGPKKNAATKKHTPTKKQHTASKKHRAAA